MHVEKEQLEPTKVKLTISASQAELDKVHRHVVQEMSQNVKVPGFRPGKAPATLVEKQLDATRLQTEFLDHAVNELYTAAIQQHKIRPVAQPAISLTKFVPFSTLEFTAETEAVGDIKLGDYKTLKLAPPEVTITAKDINEVLENLRQRAAKREPVERAAKDGDEVVIDFVGTDAKTHEPIDGADGKDYTLQIGSQSFIPGFEEALVGLKAGVNKEFPLTFPKDYGVPALQSRKVQFKVTIHQVQALTPPKLDDAFAAGAGPFKTLSELKADIKKQLSAERQREAQATYENQLLEKLAGRSTVVLPPALIDEDLNYLEDEEKRNLAYRGQTWEEHLKAEGLTADQHREQKRPHAEARLTAGLLLSEISDHENIAVTPEELDLRIQLLKGQYAGDPAMLAELDKPENRRDILNRLRTEKTLDKLRSYASSIVKKN